MAATLKDVAELAGVSRSAVSRAFTPGASVSAKMRLRVEKAAKQLGYEPNALASSLTTGRTKLIGLISDNFHNPVFLEVFDLFTRGLQEHGLRPLLVNLSGETDPANSVRMLRQYSVDGVVVASSTLPSSFAKAFADADMLVVHAFGRCDPPTGIHVVGLDNIEAGRMAARELVDRGYTSVGFMGGPKSATTTQDRFVGFTSELEQHPEISVTHSFAESYSFSAGRDEMLRLVEAGPAEAYFCGDDVLSIGALSAIKDAGLSVPDDIGIIGVNDMEMSAWENISLTTIHQPISEIVGYAIEMMTKMLKDPSREPEARIVACSVADRSTLKPVINRE